MKFPTSLKWIWESGNEIWKPDFQAAVDEVVWGGEFLLTHPVGPWDADKESGLGSLAAQPQWMGRAESLSKML